MKRKLSREEKNRRKNKSKHKREVRSIRFKDCRCCKKKELSLAKSVECKCVWQIGKLSRDKRQFIWKKSRE